MPTLRRRRAIRCRPRLYAQPRPQPPLREPTTSSRRLIQESCWRNRHHCSRRHRLSSERIFAVLSTARVRLRRSRRTVGRGQEAQDSAWQAGHGKGGRCAPRGDVEVDSLATPPGPVDASDSSSGALQMFERNSNSLLTRKILSGRAGLSTRAASSSAETPCSAGPGAGCSNLGQR